MRFSKTPEDKRPDVISTTNEALSEAIIQAIDDGGLDASGARQSKRRRSARDEAGDSLRYDYVEGIESDPNGYERVIGESDLTSINFLDRGKRAANAVCRIKIPMDGGTAFGSGFLVGPRLLITNNHVLPDKDTASQAQLEFGYEHDVDGVLREPTRFNLRPSEIFFTSGALDFTLVAVAPLSDSGVPIDRFGRLPLLPLSGKSVNGEWVTVIQHPNGQPKQIAVRSSQIIKFGKDEVPGLDGTRFIFYTTDTEPGSSGSPVLNDQWQVVALHHKAVPAPRGKGEAANSPLKWIANEGVRISAIFERLEKARFQDESASAALNRLADSIGMPPLQPIEIPQTEQYAPLAEKHWTSIPAKLGYDPDFFGKADGLQISIDDILGKPNGFNDDDGKPFPAIREQMITAPLLNEDDRKPGYRDILDYLHFSVVMHKKRRFALMTAVNIHGGQLVHPGKRKDTWRLDGRIDKKYQSDDTFYKKSEAEEKVYFSRGHLVRLLDPCWAPNQDKALSHLGMEHSFHFTNAAPQFQEYNDINWGNLEDYLLQRAQDSEQKLTVFTGPVYRESDPFYGNHRTGGPWRIPISFWKVAVLQKAPGKYSAAAFINGQAQYVKALYEAKVFSGLKPYSVDDMRRQQIQTTIVAIEKETGLNFSMLRSIDAHGSLEATRQTRWINGSDDIQI